MAELNKKVIVIDAGHGGRDSGAVGLDDDARVYLEKDYNLRIALRIANLLSSKFKVVLTREIDIQVLLEMRCKTANDLKASAFISIHQNSCEKKNTATGFEIWHYIHSKKSQALAKEIQEEMRELDLSDRGVKESDTLYVPRHTECPAVLVECCFINNDKDLEYLKSNWELIAEKIATGIEVWIKS